MNGLEWQSELCYSCGFYQPHIQQNDRVPGFCHSEEQREKMGYLRRCDTSRACPAWKTEIDEKAAVTYIARFLHWLNCETKEDKNEKN